MPLIREELQRRRLPRPGPLLHDLSQVLYLPFDHDDGPYARDRSGYNNHGTIYGATREAGKVADALSFDGVDNYVEADGVVADLTLTDPWTWMAWVNFKTLNKHENVLAMGDSDGAEYIWLCKTNTNKMKLATNGKTPGEGTTNLSANTWYHFCSVYDGSKFLIYLGGSKEYDVTPTADPFVGIDNFRVGRAYKAGAWYNPLEGMVDEARVYKGALTEAEIRLIMNMRGLI